MARHVGGRVISEELHEQVEKAHDMNERSIGLTMAILAVLLAVATMLSHRAETEEVLLETQATDQWAYYQAKDIRYHAFDSDSQMALLMGDKGVKASGDFKAQSLKQKADADKIQKIAQGLDDEVKTIGKKASFY